MATHDYIISNQSGAAFRTDLNNALAAIVSNNSNSSSPATTYAYQWWADTSAGVLKIRNSANNAWIELLQLDGTLTLEDGSASAPGLAFRDDTNTGIFSSDADTFNIATGGTERFQITSTGLAIISTTADEAFRINSTNSNGGHIRIQTSGTTKSFIGQAAGISGSLGGANDLAIRSAEDIVFSANNDNTVNLKINADGHVDVIGNLDVGAGIDCTGIIVAVDGLRVDADGSSSADYISVGASQDLKIYHTGSAAYIQNETGNLFIGSNFDDDDGGDIRIQPKFGENSIVALDDGAVELYHDNTKKFETTSTGVTVTGTVSTDAVSLGDSEKITLGASDDMELLHDGSDNFIKVAGVGGLRLDSDQTVLKSADGSETLLSAVKNGSVELYHDNVKRMNTSSSGLEMVGLMYFGQGSAVNVMNRDNDGTLLEFQTTGTARGSITVSGNTVSYNGGHLSRWSQIKGLSTTDTSARPTIYQGTVMSNLDDLCAWSYPDQLYTEQDKTDGKIPDGKEVGDVKKAAHTVDNQQLNMTKISDTEGEKDVAGVFWAWDDNGNEYYANDFFVAMTGDMVIRVAASTTVARGDLLISAGDGTAKPQSDDIVRSSTIAKITSTNHTATYADGSKAYPCLLMAC